ncbi:putative E3 ubiquitin ligase [Handroanthus impetiginosus]|uniref:Putative E3 ubiquitin ligase n=1 Tax=Handroanthus impetiginosus TaxID=429701 RepID=A0A2G9I4A7_9LAMI|nr:putative E3 ubiquitin ligase [Handroanthus impetiginosus]
MAVAGLPNGSAFGPSFCYSTVSRRWDDERGRPSIRASTLLQMWRELEGEDLVSQSYMSRKQRNSSDSECASTCTSVGQGSENGDDISQDSDDSENRGLIGSEMEHEDNNSVISEQSSDLGEIERERVRQIFQEWMNICPKGHSSYGFHRKNRSGQWLGENERERVRIIREWVQMTAQQRDSCAPLQDGVADIGSQIEQVRDGLVVDRPEIGARRRIRRLCGRQTLLDLLLRAQSERKRELLSLTEQKPVSDFAHRNRIQALLRGRFLRNERLVLDERPSSIAATELGLLRQRHTVSDLREGFLSKLDGSASTSMNITGLDSSSSDENNGERELPEIHIASELGTASDRSMSPEELVRHVTEAEGPILDNEESEQESLLCSREEPGLEINTTNTNELSLESADISYREPLEVYNESYESRSDAAYVHEVDDNTTDLEGNTNVEFHSQDASYQVEELQQSVIENEEGAWQQLNTAAYTDWADGSREEGSSNNVEVRDQMQELQEDWPGHDLQEAIDSWLDMPSEEVGTSFARIDTFYFPDDDDDNVHNMELRELFSRRRVSSLLRSSFRESLDQVLQSHVERLGHASGDWEQEDEEQLIGDQNRALSDGAERNPFDLASSALYEELQGANWPHHNSNQLLGTEWEIINEMRIDMARLHHRMNNMQSMLEACMDMQMELQRLVRQEVSAALNRSTISRDESHDNQLHDESQWDHVRKGICCLCLDIKTDSLLYRCGHMCTCSKCAENLVQWMGRCPLCQAPVVEVVRAYFIQ